MKLASAALISLTAAVLSSLLGGLVAFGQLEGWIVTLPFTLAGSLFLLLPAYAALKQKGFDPSVIYALLLLLGSVSGGLMLALLSGGVMDFAALGSGYGALTAALWIATHWLTRSRQQISDT